MKTAKESRSADENYKEYEIKVQSFENQIKEFEKIEFDFDDLNVKNKRLADELKCLENSYKK